MMDPKDLAQWAAFAKREKSIVLMMRTIGDLYNLNKFELSSITHDIFPDTVTGEDRQVIWKWKFAQSDEGFDDNELDELLSHLLE